MTRSPGRFAGIVTLAIAVTAAARAVQPAPNPVYDGAWQLALAQGRLRCLTPATAISAELRIVVDRDLAATRRGFEAMAACSGAAPVSMAAPPASARTAGQLAAALASLDEQYRTRSRQACGDRQAFSCRVAFDLGAAAGDAACVISTWNQPLPPSIAGRVRADLQTAKLTLRLLPSSSDWIRELDAIDRQLDLAHGERIFRAIEVSSRAIAAALTPPIKYHDKE